MRAACQALCSFSPMSALLLRAEVLFLRKGSQFSHVLPVMLCWQAFKVMTTVSHNFFR
jgi:hypothetical protein